MPERSVESRSVSDEAATFHLSVPDRALKSSAHLNGWIARPAFDDLRGPLRARGSERHAEWDVREPVRRAGAGVAVALAAAASTSVRHRARGNGRSSMETVNLKRAFVFHY
jgi:hypothetical protein